MRLARIICILLLAATAFAAGRDKEELLRRADEAVYEGKTNAARSYYEEAIKAGADLTSDYARAQNLGLCYLNGSPHDFAKAAEWLEIAVRLRPNSDDTRLYLAQALAWGGKHDAAISQYRKLWEAHPDVADYAVGLATTYHRSGKAPAAFAVFERFLETNPSQINVRLEYARLLAFDKRYSESMSQYQVILNADPNNVSAQVGIAKVTSWQSDLPRALELYNKILKRNPEVYEAIVGKAFTLLWMGRDDEARPLFQAAARRMPGDREVAAALKSLRPAAPKPPAEAARAEAPPKPPQPQIAQAPPAPSLPPPPAEDPVVVLTRQAEAAAARGDYTAAVHLYHQVLEAQPQNQQAMLQIARVLSWARDYPESVAQYEQVLQIAPGNVQARLERARVLSWSQKFDVSIREYEQVLRDVQATSQPAVPVKDVRLEYARVLSWAKRYDESLAQLAILLPAGTRPEMKDYDAILAKAHVLAWARRYEESLAVYEQALALKPTDIEARLGKAQTLYYAGRLSESAALLRDLLRDQPKNTDANLTLASVEHGLGNNGRALRLLSNVPPNNDSTELHRLIKQEMRPVLRLRFGFEDDIEEPTFPPADTIRVLRYSTALEFSVHPNVRMEVSSVVAQTNTSNSLLAGFGPDGLATETFARLTFRLKPWLMMVAGAGDGSTGRGVDPVLGQVQRQHHFLYDIHPVLTHGGLRVDGTATRHVADYTPLAVHDNVVQSRQSVDVTYNWQNRLRMGAEYWHAAYTVDAPDSQQFATAANGGSAFVTPVLYRRERFTVEGGLRYENYTFSDSAAAIDTALGSAGFFTPRVYQRYAGTGRISWNLHPKLQLDVNGTFGPQRIFAFFNNPPAQWGTTGSFGTQLTLRLGRLTPYLAYDYFDTATAAAPGQVTGSYQSHSVVGGLAYRF